MSVTPGGFERLVAYLLALSPEDFAATRLEDVTLCAAWYDSNRENDAIQEQYNELRSRLDLWVRNVAPSQVETEGHRQQPLLRILIREAVQGRVQEMTRDEVDVLYFAFALAQRTGREDIFERPLSCLKPFMHEIEKRRADLPTSPGLPAVGLRMGICFLEDLKSAESREVKVFAGLNLRIRGPVLVRQGDTKLLGNLPADCAMVVEGGSCYVSGMVLGKLAATNSCEVFDNISGAVVSRRGNVSARNLLTKTLVVAKEGNVLCCAAENPHLVFACQSIQVRHTVAGGSYICRAMAVGEEITGGRIQITEELAAPLFRGGTQTPLYVVLRRALICQDYGEVLSIEAGKLLNNAVRLRQRINNLEDLLQITEHEADQYAGNILLYLLGEQKDLAERLSRIQQMRRRLAFLARLQAGLRAVTARAEDRLATMADDAEQDESDLDGGAEAESTPIEQLRRELAMLASEGAIDRDLHELREDVLQLGKRLQRSGMTRDGVLQVLGRLLLKADEIAEQHATLEREASTAESAIERSIERAAIIERAKAECARVEVLDQLLLAARKLRGKESLLRRSNERSVKVLRRNIENRVSRGAEYRTMITEFESRIRKIREKLWEIHQVSLPNSVFEGWSGENARVTGHFEAGVWICAWQHLIEYGRASDKGLVVTIDTGEDVVTYARTEQGTVEAV